MQWNRVYDLPDFVYFNHSIHVSAGVACETCHGQVDEMPLIRKQVTLYMEWCLECHRHPEEYIQPQAAAFGQNLVPAESEAQPAEVEVLVAGDEPQVDLDDCFICHR